MTTERPYRLGTGLVIFNAMGLVLMGERFSPTGAWQFPQGGIDAGEDPWTAAQRELWEETGITPDKVTLLAETPDWLTYDFPPSFRDHPTLGHHRGQKQKWFAVRFLGTDADIHLDAHSEPEFSRVRWVPLVQAAELIVPFKRDLYAQIIQAFLPLTKPVDN
jgi:putative (di)nucleoside polyphosphate hydrolase